MFVGELYILYIPNMVYIFSMHHAGFVVCSFSIFFYAKHDILYIYMPNMLELYIYMPNMILLLDIRPKYCMLVIQIQYT